MHESCPIRMSHVPYATIQATRMSNVHQLTYMSYVIRQTSHMNMGWLRLVSSLNVYDSFAKEPYIRDKILQERLIILRSLRIESTPYEFMSRDVYVISPVTCLNYVTQSISRDSWVINDLRHIRQLTKKCASQLTYGSTDLYLVTYN